MLMVFPLKSVYENKVKQRCAKNHSIPPAGPSSKEALCYYCCCCSAVCFVSRDYHLCPHIGSARLIKIRSNNCESAWDRNLTSVTL